MTMTIALMLAFVYFTATTIGLMIGLVNAWSHEWENTSHEVGVALVLAYGMVTGFAAIGAAFAWLMVILGG